MTNTKITALIVVSCFALLGLGAGIAIFWQSVLPRDPTLQLVGMFATLAGAPLIAAVIADIRKARGS